MICERCGGGKIIPQFKHLNGGKCFKCNGKGFILKENERLIEYLDENKNVIGSMFCTKETKAHIVKSKGIELGAKTMRMFKGN